MKKHVMKLLTLFTAIVGVFGGSDTTHPSSCVNLPDGVHWVRPLVGRVPTDRSDDFPSIQVRCYDGYMILDYSLDNNIASYFSSFWIWTDDAASSALSDRVTWTNWYLPYSDTNTLNFRLSPDCNTCETSDDKGSNDFTAYFMTGNYIGVL